jgi:hypothetical protein
LYTLCCASLCGGFAELTACNAPRVAAEQTETEDAGNGTLTPPPVDKIDLLIDIDNSSSMADKQRYLASAIPELLQRIAFPNCIDGSGAATGTTVDESGNCPIHSTAEFRAIRDVHVAVVSSSLGSRGGDLCDPSGGAHNDDRGELRGSSLDGGPPPDLNLGEDGCGIESQIESWYRFLIQPDPYDSITVDSSKNPPVANWSGVDLTILEQRHDFLRPDSLVMIVVLSDEDGSEIDVRSLSGTGFNFMLGGFEPPRGTSQCDTNPGDPNCTSCGFPSAPQTDPNCQLTGGKYTAADEWGFDPNLRHVHMKQRYGVDAQFPLDRYVAGLTQRQIPDRDGEYPEGAGSYIGDANCTNALFASSLPDGSKADTQTLCNLSVGFQRTPDRVIFLTISGVPSQLLPGDPANPSAPTAADWTKILGKDPEAYDLTGIDPHMIESYEPRPGLPGPSSANDADPISGREWITNAAGEGIDLESACIFPLPAPRDCTLPENSESCSCPRSTTALPASELPPFCDSTNPTMQIAARAVPTPRQLLLAKTLGAQGVVGSICPIHVVPENPADPLFGARPAMASLLARIEPLLK